MKWTTKDNVTKDIRDLETSHLENILKMLIKNDGDTIYYGGGMFPDEMYYDEDEVDNTESIEKIELELRLRKLEEMINKIIRQKS